MDNDNKSSPQNQGMQMKSDLHPISNPFAGANKVQMPTPRKFEGKDYYGVADVAKIIGVTRQNVSWWHNQGLFVADVRTHDGRYLYEIERVMQLKSVYHPNWTRGGYEPAPVDEKQSRINETMKFFNMLFDGIPAGHFSYLMTFTTGYGVTYSFAISDQTQREAMAYKAVELSELGNDVWHAVNTVAVSPKGGKRGDETAVSYQTAVVVDIDICSDAHKSDNLAANFDEAKSFLPFAPSIIVNSGFGIHAYYIWEKPLAITNTNREEIKRRNNLLIDIVRQRANGKKIDGVGDLPRILRTPGTYNYKLGKDNPPLCHIVEGSVKQIV